MEGLRMYLKEIGSENLRWMKLAQDRAQFGITRFVRTVSATIVLIK
jgi:hypothetical protein